MADIQIRAGDYKTTTMTLIWPELINDFILGWRDLVKLKMIPSTFPCPKPKAMPHMLHSNVTINLIVHAEGPRPEPAYQQSLTI